MSYKSYVDEFITDLEAATQKTLDTIGQFIKDSAKLLSAVDTGEYRRDWDYETLAYSVLIGNGKDYAEFLEFGTVKMKAQPALTSAFENNIKAIKAIVEDYYAELD